MAKSGRKANATPVSTQLAVLKAATEEFAEHGLAGSRVDRIAARAGVNKQALYYYYGSKDGLFAAALRQGYINFRDAFLGLDLGDGPPPERLARLIDATFENFTESRYHITMISEENMHKGVHLPEIEEELEGIVSPFLSILKEIMLDGEANGYFKKDIDVEQIYMSIVSECMFHFTNHVTMSRNLKKNLMSRKESMKRKLFIRNLILNAVKA